VIGQPGASTWRDERAAHVQGYDAAYCFPDADQAGERMADKITSSIRWTMCVRLPAGHDVRVILQNGGPSRLDQYITRGEEAAVLLAGMRTCRTIAELEQWLSEVTW
jgi:hypothetical protein